MSIKKNNTDKKLQERKLQLELEHEIMVTVADVEGYARPRRFNRVHVPIPEEPKTYKQYLEEDKLKDAIYWAKKYNMAILIKTT